MKIIFLPWQYWEVWGLNFLWGFFGYFFCSQCLEVGTAEVFGRCGIFAASTTLTPCSKAPNCSKIAQNSNFPNSKIAQNPYFPNSKSAQNSNLHFCSNQIIWLPSFQKDSASNSKLSRFKGFCFLEPSWLQQSDFWRNTFLVLVAFQLLGVIERQRCKKRQIWQIYLCDFSQDSANLLYHALRCQDWNIVINSVLGLCYYHYGHIINTMVIWIQMQEETFRQKYVILLDRCFKLSVYFNLQENTFFRQRQVI